MIPNPMHPWNQPPESGYNRRIFDEELDSFLPEKVFDFHVHIAPPDSLSHPTLFSCGGVPLSGYTYEQLAADLELAYPGRRTAALCFGFPHPEYDRGRNNQYVASGADGSRFFPLRLFDPHGDTRETLEQDFDRFRFLGLKPYPNYARPLEVSKAQIDEMLPPWAMEVAHERRLIIMLHIPRPGRLEDPLNRQQIRQLCQRWPGARIILAHVGRAYYRRGIEGYLDELAGFPNLYFDLAMVQHWEVLAYLFARIPVERILFGSDAPIALAQGKAVEINHQYTYVTPRPWSLSLCDPQGKLRFTSFLNEELRAIRQAAETVGYGRSAVEALFDGNARQIIASVGRGP